MMNLLPVLSFVLVYYSIPKGRLNTKVGSKNLKHKF
jgi:hypothetical protein